MSDLKPFIDYAKEYQVKKELDRAIKLVYENCPLCKKLKEPCINIFFTQLKHDYENYSLKSQYDDGPSKTEVWDVLKAELQDKCSNCYQGIELIEQRKQHKLVFGRAKSAMTKAAIKLWNTRAEVKADD